MPILSQFDSPSFNLLVEENRWQLGAKTPSPDVVEQLPEIAKKYANALPETVFTAVGMNFEWRVKGDSEEDLIDNVAVSSTAASLDFSDMAKRIVGGFDDARRLIACLRGLACVSEPEEMKKPVPRIRVLQEFKGNVVRIDGDQAQIELIDQDGREAHAECDPSDLIANGIGEGDIFTCSVVRQGRAFELVFQPVERAKLPSESVARIRADVANDLLDFDDDA